MYFPLFNGLHSFEIHKIFSEKKIEYELKYKLIKIVSLFLEESSAKNSERKICKNVFVTALEKIT